jgi:hypothetical protein
VGHESRSIADFAAPFTEPARRPPSTPDVYSPPILEVGVAAALAHVDFEVRRLIERGGLYLWRR